MVRRDRGSFRASRAYCYVDKALDKGGLTDKCPSNTPQLLRFAEVPGVKTPAQDSVAFIACLGAPVGVGASAGTM